MLILFFLDKFWINSVNTYDKITWTGPYYSHQNDQHHHRPRRKYGPYMVPSDPYLLHSGPSDYFFAGSSRSPANATSANLRDNFTSVQHSRTQHQRSPQQRPNTLR